MSESRRRTRVHFTTRAEVQVGDQRFADLETQDLSHKGVFVKGSHPVQAGQACLVTVHLQEGSQERLDLHMQGSVKRITDQGMAIDFTSMDPDTYMHLRQLVLLNAEDPEKVEGEFGTPVFEHQQNGVKK